MQHHLLKDHNITYRVLEHNNTREQIGYMSVDVDVDVVLQIGQRRGAELVQLLKVKYSKKKKYAHS